MSQWGDGFKISYSGHSPTASFLGNEKGGSIYSSQLDHGAKLGRCILWQFFKVACLVSTSSKFLCTL